MSYGCFNRAPFDDESTSYGINSRTGDVVVSVVPFRMSRDCQYALFEKYADPGCVGCVHRDLALKKREALVAQKVS